jgi:hypothetical protein
MTDQDAALADPRARRVLGEMRARRAALRASGPAAAPAGLADGVLARLARAGTGVDRPAEVVTLAARRDRILVILQAASLAALLFAYGALLASDRVHDVGPRWASERAGETSSSGSGSACVPAPDSASPPVAMLPRVGLDSGPLEGGPGADGWSWRRSASPTSDSNASTTRTPSS